jgi:hypothetical protein
MPQSRVVCQHWSNHSLLLVWLLLLLWLGRLHTLRGHLALLLLLLLGKLLQLYTQLFLLLLLEFKTHTQKKKVNKHPVSSNETAAEKQKHKKQHTQAFINKITVNTSTNIRKDLLRVIFWVFPWRVVLVTDVSEHCVCSRFIGDTVFRDVGY